MNNGSELLAQDWMGITPPWGTSDFTTLDGIVAKIHELLDFFVPFAALIAVGIIVYGGYQLILAAGDPEKIDLGTKAITNGVIGLLIVFAARMGIIFLIDAFL